MSLVRRGVEAVGADYHQWRVLTRAMLKVDMRSTSPLQVGDRPQRDGVGLTFFFVHGFTGVAAAVVVAFVPDLFGGTMIAMSIIMVLLATALLTDYQTVVSSPADFEVLGYQPISSRTYFLSRLTNLMFYAGLIGVLTGGPSLLVVFVKYGGLALAGWLIALATAVFWVVLIVTTGYAAMLHVVPPDRLKRGLGYLQLLTSTAVYGSFFLLPLLIGGRIAVSFVVEASPWLLLYPPVWFACLPRIATGSLDILDGFSLLIVVGSIAVMAGMARGRLSLAYTERLGALLSSGTRPRRKTGMARRRRIPRWRARLPPELAIMATLIRAQFRHDMRFRMVVLSAFPLALCMLAVPFLRQLESAADEIGLDATMAMGLVHLSTILLPLTLLDNLRYSESFRASWIFFSTPSDPGEIDCPSGKLHGDLLPVPVPRDGRSRAVLDLRGCLARRVACVPARAKHGRDAATRPAVHALGAVFGAAPQGTPVRSSRGLRNRGKPGRLCRPAAADHVRHLGDDGVRRGFARHDRVLRAAAARPCRSDPTTRREDRVRRVS
ncbi:MAG: hypothetical protein OXU77_15655 [Gammaproteobacteria bacterium]|nr:hypothetical protein [Gammaproteobacteria bacterium]